MSCERLTDNNVLSGVELPHVLPDGGAANAGVTLGPHVVTQRHHNLLDLLSQLPGGGQEEGLALPQVGVDLLQDSDGEGRGLTGSRLSLGDNIHALKYYGKQKSSLSSRRTNLDARDNGSLLDSRWLLETIGIDSSEELFLQVHVIEVLADL